MNKYTLYNIKTGEIYSTITCFPSDLIHNVPEGFGCVLGMYDAQSQKVDHETGQAVDYQPPQPSPNYQWDATTKRWVYVKTDADIATEVRAMRDRMIAESDWMVVRQQETGDLMLDAWKAYRQALRDITKQAGFPRTVAWPSRPV